MNPELLKKKEVQLRDWVGEIVFDPSAEMTDQLAKVLAMHAAFIEKLAYYLDLRLRVERVEAHRTGVNFIVTGNLEIEEIVEGDPEGEKERKRMISRFWNGGMYSVINDINEVEGVGLDCFASMIRFSGPDNLVRLGYFSSEPEKEGLGKLRSEWKDAGPLAGVLGRNVSGELQVLDLAEDRVGQTLLIANDLQAVSEMTRLVLKSLRQNSSNRQLRYAIPGDMEIKLADRSKEGQLFSEGVTTAKALADLLAIVEKRKRQEGQRIGGTEVLAVIDLSRINFSDRVQRGNFARLMSMEPQNFGVRLLLVGTSRMDKAVLDNFVRPIVGTLYESGGYYNSIRWLENRIDPFNRPFTTEWVRTLDGKETVFLPAKLGI